MIQRPVGSIGRRQEAQCDRSRCSGSPGTGSSQTVPFNVASGWFPANALGVALNPMEAPPRWPRAESATGSARILREVKEAYRHFEGRGHFGKVVIRHD